MKKNLKLATSYILKGKSITCHIIVAGFFYACILIICGSVLPCKSVMGLLPLRCKTTGKAEPFFYYSPYLNSTEMSLDLKSDSGLTVFFHPCCACPFGGFSWEQDKLKSID